MAGMMLKMMNPMGSMPVSRSRSEKISYMVHNPISRSVLTAARGRNILKIAGLRIRLDLSRIQIRPPRKKNRIRIPLHEHQIWIRIRPYKLNFCISKLNSNIQLIPPLFFCFLLNGCSAITLIPIFGRFCLFILN